MLPLKIALVFSFISMIKQMILCNLSILHLYYILNRQADEVLNSFKDQF